VFVSPDVNAGVFYDLSLLNLVFPSRKNLDIGLGLVNVLSLGELRAVLAHEFGHFAQRAMAVGRWVYMAQQIAGALVARRDKLDDFLSGLSHSDPRIAWLGWGLGLVVWSIRSLVDSAFRLVLLMQRALSREMEFNADLVAVALTGSDALIHALHKLQAADDAWARAAGFARGEAAQGRCARDVFALQTQVMQHMGALLNEPLHGRVPPVPAEQPQAHRLFKAELAQPPRMWLTHPLNHEREANAKQRYVPAPIDEREAWSLFEQPQALREQLTQQLLADVARPAEPAVQPAPAADAELLQTLRGQFEREYLLPRYRGVYFGRALARHTADAAALAAAQGTPDAAGLAALYPQALAQHMAQLRQLDKELEQLQALKQGLLSAPPEGLRHRGRPLRRAALDATIASVQQEQLAVQRQLQAHDQQCHGLHLALARQLGQGWEAHLQGLLQALHYGEHSEADLRDLQGLLHNTLAIETATRRVSKRGVDRIIQQANALQSALAAVFAQAGALQLDPALAARLKTDSWQALLGELQLPGASRDNINDWIKAVDSWVDHTAGACAGLRNRALDQLLASEQQLAAHRAAGTQPEAAPPATRVPAGYATLLAGQERPRQTRLGLWARFQTASGLVPATARLVVAGGVVAAVLGMGGGLGQAQIHVYNGLARPVMLQLGDTRMRLEPASASLMDAPRRDKVRVQARTVEGQEIESFDADVSGSFARYVYNVAGAAPLVEWTATYGNGTPRAPRPLGAPRWTHSTVDHLFTDPPRSISTKGGGGTRDVLSGLGEVSPMEMLHELREDNERRRLAQVHARWDPLDSRHILTWLTLLQGDPAAAPVLQARAAEAPDSIAVLRAQQDGASAEARQALCRQIDGRAAAQPQNLNLAYLSARCLPDEAAKDRAFLAGHASHPEHGWFAYAAGYAMAQQGRWSPAVDAYLTTLAREPALADAVAPDIVRMRRLAGLAQGPSEQDLARRSELLRRHLALESGQGVAPGSPQVAYLALSRGELAQALSNIGFETQQRGRLLRLLAASDGSQGDWVAQALALSTQLGEQGLDADTVWSSYALALREGHASAAALREAAQRALHGSGQAEAQMLLAVAERLQAGAGPAELEPQLRSLPIELRGQAYAMACVLRGARTPAEWRQAARRLLFVAERPYFKG
jgi:hypothetical protein